MQAFDLTAMKSFKYKSRSQTVYQCEAHFDFSHLFLFPLSAFLRNGLKTWDKSKKTQHNPRVIHLENVVQRVNKGRFKLRALKGAKHRLARSV